MKKYFGIGLVFLMALYIQGCEKDTMVYEGEPGNVSGIYFLYSKTYSMSGAVRVYHYQDSMEVTFASVASNQTTTTINVPVYVLGNLSNEDRTFKVRISEGTATEGVDYEPLQEEYILPAGKASTSLPLVLKRTEKLKSEKLDLTVELVKNENFELLLPYKINDDGKTEITTTHIKVVFSEIYTEPRQYTLFGTSKFGPFTVKKFEFINSVMHWSPSDWNDGTVTYGILPYAARKVQAELQERANNDTPEYDEDGSFMQLVSPYLVDYSKYETE